MKGKNASGGYVKKPKYMTEDGKIRWHSDIAFNKKWTAGRWYLSARMTKGNGVMGRLGGGWKWKLGMLVGRSEVVFELFVMSVRVGRVPLPLQP